MWKYHGHNTGYILGGTQEEIPSLDGSPAGVQHIFISFLSKDNKIF